MRLLGSLGVVIALASPASAQTLTPGPGVPLDLATRRAALVSDLRYELALTIPDAFTAPIAGSITIRFALADASLPLVLDFDTSAEHVQSVEANMLSVDTTFVNGHIVVPASALKPVIEAFVALRQSA